MYYLYNHNWVVDDDLARADTTLNDDEELKVRICLDEEMEAQICELPNSKIEMEAQNRDLANLKDEPYSKYD